MACFHMGERALFIFPSLNIVPDKISRKFVFGVKEGGKLHYTFKIDFSRSLGGFFNSCLFQ